MSSAFVKEREGGEAFEDLPDRPISPHTNFVTPQGLAQMEAEVARLQSEFSALTPGAKADEARVTRDLAYWTARLGSAELVEPMSGDTVHFGSTVTIVKEDDTRQTFRIVGEDEADPADGSVSHVSPLTRALIGKGVGDEAVVAGQSVEIIAVD